jgi:protein-S-isoprenylcysteine O-methyltransferase Ste14
MTAWLVQHCGMARMKFKKLTGLHESPLERPLFGLAANFTWFATLYFWKPINTCASFNVFDANALLLAPAAALIVAGSALIVALLWMLPDHVFGTNHYKGATATTGNEDAEIIYDFPYGMVRHPASAGFVWLYIGVALMAGLAINHAFLAAAWIGFIFTGTVFEEKGLHREFGEK